MPRYARSQECQYKIHLNTDAIWHATKLRFRSLPTETTALTAQHATPTSTPSAGRERWTTEAWCGGRGHVWKIRSADISIPSPPILPASHDDVIDAFKLCINNLRVIFEPQKVHHGPRVALPGDGVASPISVSYKMCLQCSLMIL